MSTSSAARGRKATQKSTYRGQTLAYNRFRQSERRTRTLLDAGLFGLEEKGKHLESLRAKVADVKAPPGPRPRDYEPEVVSKPGDSGEFLVTMDVRSAQILRKAMTFAVGQHKALRFHYYSILAVYVWGTYETYLSMLLAELYTRRPQLLISNETLTYREVVENRDALVPHLIEQQLGRVRKAFAWGKQGGAVEMS